LIRDEFGQPLLTGIEPSTKRIPYLIFPEKWPKNSHNFYSTLTFY
jgi:hypothetical protein